MHWKPQAMAYRTMKLSGISLRISLNFVYSVWHVQHEDSFLFLSVPVFFIQNNSFFAVQSLIRLFTHSLPELGVQKTKEMVFKELHHFFDHR